MELNPSMVRVEEAEASRATGPWESILLLWGVGSGVKQTWAQIPAPPLTQLCGLGQTTLSELQFIFQTGNLISTSWDYSKG